MRAMVLYQPKTHLQMKDLPLPIPQKGQVLIHIIACGICRTDLHIWDGELKSPHLPLIMGHQIVGTIADLGPGSHRFPLGQRVGVPWLGKSCGNCPFCLSKEENLCDQALYTGYQINGGFADYCVANEDFIYPIPEGYFSSHAAPLLCAGLIGYRSFRLTGKPKRIGFYGFGAAAHILIQIASSQGCEVWAFTRPDDKEAQNFAKKLKATWVGDITEKPETLLDAAIIFAPAGDLIPLALKSVKKGGSVICAGIHMSDIPSFPYSLLYGERLLRSVTNLTREDGEEFFNLLKNLKIETKITTYPLEKANEAIMDLKEGKLTGTAVLIM